MGSSTNPETIASTDSVVEHGATVYSTQLQTTLESQHFGEFVAVDPAVAANGNFGQMIPAPLPSLLESSGSPCTLVRLGLM